jgi:toxin FitB
VSYLLDTNVLSEWSKPRPDPGVIEWLDTAKPDELYLSVVTIGEVCRGIAMLQLRGAHRKAAAIESWLAATGELFADRVVPVSARIAREWGAIAAAHTIPMADGLIGATARVHGWTVVTRNAKDIEPTGARVLNPYTG